MRRYKGEVLSVVQREPFHAAELAEQRLHGGGSQEVSGQGLERVGDPVYQLVEKQQLMDCYSRRRCK